MKTINNDLLKLGVRIRETRQSFGWSQEHLAGLSGLDRSYLGGVERGERNISFINLSRIAMVLNVDIASLTEGLPERQNDT